MKGLALYCLIAREVQPKITISAGTHFDSLGIDSLDYLGLIDKIENEYRVTVPDAELVKWRTVGDIEQWLEAQPTCV